MFICRKAEGFLQFLLPQPRQPLYPWLTILRHWSWLRAEVHKPLIIPVLNHFDSSQRLAETVASRVDGTWGEKAGQLLQLGISAARSMLAAHSAYPREKWMVSGDVLDKTRFVFMSVLCISRSHSLLSFLCAHQEHSSHTSTRGGHLKATRIELYKYLGQM